MFNVKVSENTEFGIPQELGASYQSTMVNVVNTIIGAGILSIPSTIHSTGIIGSFLFLFGSLLISLLGGFYLIVAAAYTKRDSFGEIAYALYGPTVKLLANLTVIIYEMGVSVPGDISVIGSENDLFAEYNTISLSTIDTGGDLMGRRAWELLCRHLNDPALPLESFIKTVHARFIPRESIGMVSEKSVFFKLRENIKQRGAAAKR